MWATKHKVACMESGNLGKWRPGPTSSTPPWKLFSWLWDWTLLLKKIKLQKWQQQQQQKRHLQIGDNRTINFFVLRKSTKFSLIAPTTAIWKLFLSAGALHMSSIGSGGEMESISRPLEQTLLLSFLCPLCNYSATVWRLQSQRPRLPACLVLHKCCWNTCGLAVKEKTSRW